MPMLFTFEHPFLKDEHEQPERHLMLPVPGGAFMGFYVSAKDLVLIDPAERPSFSSALRYQHLVVDGRVFLVPKITYTGKSRRVPGIRLCGSYVNVRTLYEDACSAIGLDPSPRPAAPAKPLRDDKTPERVELDAAQDAYKRLGGCRGLKRLERAEQAYTAACMALGEQWRARRCERAAAIADRAKGTDEDHLLWLRIALANVDSASPKE